MLCAMVVSYLAQGVPNSLSSLRTANSCQCPQTQLSDTHTAADVDSKYTPVKATGWSVSPVEYNGVRFVSQAESAVLDSKFLFS